MVPAPGWVRWERRQEEAAAGMAWKTGLWGYFLQRRKMHKAVKYVKGLHKSRDRKICSKAGKSHD